MSTTGQDPRKETLEHVDRPSLEQPSRSARRLESLGLWSAPLAFALVAFLPLLPRLLHPTILGDDVARIVDLINLPFRQHLFRPFGDHVAPGFQLVSWLTWEAIGHDIRLAPIGFTVASATAWILVLFLLGIWLKREAGSWTATLVAIAFVAQSPLVLETAWWYSSSSFSWAVAGILISLLGASWIATSPRRSLFWIAIGAALAPAGTSLGILAAPLAILRAALQPGARRRMKLLAAAVAAAGFVGFEAFIELENAELVRSARSRSVPSVDPVAGLAYTVSVPSRLLIPSTIGVPASSLVVPLPSWIVWGTRALTLLATALPLAWPHSRWDRRLILIGLAMIYAPYMLTYSPRIVMMTEGRWSEVELLYNFAARYHVLPLMGLAAIAAALLACWPLVHRCDSRRGLPAAIGTIAGLLMLAVQHTEATHWDWMLHQPGQRETLSAVHHLGEIARAEGVSRSQLLRTFDPAWRGWNGSVEQDRPQAFHLMNLAVHAPHHVEQPLSDGQARNRLLARLSQEERIAIGAGAIASVVPVPSEVNSHTLAIGRRVEIHEAVKTVRPPFIEFEFDPVSNAHHLLLPAFATHQDVLVSWCDDAGRWRPGQSFRCRRPGRADAPVVIDLDKLVHWPADPVRRLRVKSTGREEMTLAGLPRLLR